MQSNLPADHPYKNAAPSTSTPISSSIRNLFDQDYDLQALLYRALFDQDYSLTERQLALFEQVWGMRMLAMFEQRWGDADRLRAVFRELYSSAWQLRAGFDECWGDTEHLRQVMVEQWSLFEPLRQMMEQRYSITGEPLRQMMDQHYGLLQRDLIRSVLDQPWTLAQSDVLSRQHQLRVVMTTGTDRRDLTPYHVNMEMDESLYHMVGELKIRSMDDYLAVTPLASEILITFNTDQYTFVVESKRRPRGAGSQDFILVLGSKSILLDVVGSAYRDPDQDEYSGMASAIIAQLASPVCAVDYQLVDFYIPPGLLLAESMTRMGIIKRIVEAVGGIVQTGPDGRLICRPEYPVSVNHWQDAPADMTMVSQEDFFEIIPQHSDRDGFNHFVVGDSAIASDDLYMEQLDKGSGKKEVRLVPGGDDQVRLLHSGGSWVGVVDDDWATVTEDVQVEFVAGRANLDKPVVSVELIEWRRRDLGTLQLDGNVLVAEIAENSLALVRTTLRYRKFTVIDPKEEDVQVYAEVI